MKIIVYEITIVSLERRIIFLETGRERYILNVPFEYSPDTISDATIVLKNGIWLISMAIIM